MSEEATRERSAARTRPNFTDLGNAQRFALQHAQWARYCYAWRSWLLWTGQRWLKDAGDGAMRLAKATARSLYDEANFAEADEDRRRGIKWALTTESEQRLRAMLALAQSEPGIPVSPDSLDVDPFALNVMNGTVNLKDGTLRALPRGPDHEARACRLRS